MSEFQFSAFRRRERPIVMVEWPALEPEALGRVIRSVPDDHALWRAVLQVIEEETREAQSAAEVSVGNHGVCASEVGGGQHLRRLRDRLWGMKLEGRGRVQGSGFGVQDGRQVTSG